MQILPVIAIVQHDLARLVEGEQDVNTRSKDVLIGFYFYLVK